MAQKACFYSVLGVSRESGADEIRKAYKREALKHHPDRNPGNADAEGQFKAVNEAYQVLSDEQKRRVYDQFGHEGLEGGGGAGFEGMGDMFSQMQDMFSEMFSGGFGFGGGRQQRRGGDLRIGARLTLREAAFGCKKEIGVAAPTACTDCTGTGAKAGTKPEACGPCRGTGQVSSARGFVMFTSPCAKCRGQGVFIKTPCPTCSGRGAVEKTRKVVVGFPAGIDGGQRLRVPGQGLPGPGGSPSGDLYVEVEVEEDSHFERDGVDLVVKVHVSFTEAALGAEIEVPELTAEPGTTTSLTIPPGTQSGAVFTLKGKGVPRLDGRGRGILAVVVQVEVPLALTEKAQKLVDELAAELPVKERHPQRHKE